MMSSLKQQQQLVLSLIIRGQFITAKSILLKSKYLFKFVDDSGRTLLHVAANHGKADMSRFLIECGCQVNAQDNLGITPLMLAVTEANDVATVKVLLDANADMHLKDYSQSSSLRKVIKISQTWLETLVAGSFKETMCYQILKIFFSRVEAQFAFNDEQMARTLREAHCPLALVMFMNNVSVTKYMLNSGYPLNENLRNWSTLHIAVLLMDLANVSFLVEFGADVNDQDNLQQTPLFLYDRNNDNNRVQLKILKILMKKGASLLIPRSDGVTLMEYFFTGGKKNTLMKLVKSNTAELTKCTPNGKTALHFWVDNGNKGIDSAIEFLAKKNMDVDAADNEGVTALIKAVNSDLLSKIKVLLELGAKVNFVDIIDKTKLFDALIDPWGYDPKYAKIVDMLLHRQNDKPAESPITIYDPAINVHFRLPGDNNFSLAKMILKHLVLAEADGENVSVYVHAKIESIIELKEYYQSCKLQLQSMKLTAVYESVTLYKLLTESEEKITHYARNQDFVKKFEEFMAAKSRNDFFYFDYLKKRVDSAIVLAFFRSQASHVICKLTKLYPDPDTDIYYEIVQYMNKEDLYNLIQV